ncbi:DUF3080 family protein [Pseudomonas sp. SL4(2022)]|uniref:DUF3080 family protein n=1 Tax=Pseudomonas sp. SL4(2022) TaxID=2994661 RepID=UPI002270211D|nr:DUF3080 family protein [Pseudomonas sp. SL4(2022)]WAC44293.1 DUF3080 family protein [Pseudomonas sp. SL4(2022)]
MPSCASACWTCWSTRVAALQQQISPRNNSLGKQLTPSSQLACKGDLLRTLDALAQLAGIGSTLPAALPPSAEQLDPLCFALHASDQGGQLISSLRSLSGVAQIPPATREYLQQLSGDEASLWADFQQATARHVRSWQDVLNSCGLAPGQSGWTGQAASVDQ